MPPSAASHVACLALLASLAVTAGCTPEPRPADAPASETPVAATPEATPAPSATPTPPRLTLESDESPRHLQALTVKRAGTVVFEVEASWEDAELDVETGTLSYSLDLELGALCRAKATPGEGATAWLQACWPAVQRAMPPLAKVDAPPCECASAEGDLSGPQPRVTVGYRVLVREPTPTPELTGEVSCGCAS
jgi:hypothetical protein